MTVRTPGIVLTALVSALIGGGIVVGAVAAAGDLGGSSSSKTTVVEPRTPGGGGGGGTSASTSALALPRQLYDIAAPGSVNLLVHSTGGAGEPGPHGDLGAGFVVDGSGHILTADHVVVGATQIRVTFPDGNTRPAKLLGQDTSTDVAMISVSPSGLTLHPLALGSSRSLRVGDFLAAIGDPFGYPRSLSTGVVAGLDRTIQAPNGFTIAHAIQTDAALNPGNSGGPVLDQSGKVVGIADQIATGGNSSPSGSATSSGVGFAVPIDLVRGELKQLEQPGAHVTHAYLGISTTDAPNASGVLVEGVQPGTPAARAGLHAGDVITALDGTRLHGAGDLIYTLAQYRPGQTITLTVQRNGSSQTLKVKLGTQPARATP